MLESKFGDFNLADRLEKVKTELKGNKYLKSVLKILALDSPPEDMNDGVTEGVIKGIIGAKLLEYILGRIHKFIIGVKEDLRDLMASDNWKERGSIIFKLATKAYICAIILGVVVDEIEEIAKGKKEPELIDMSKAEGEIGKIISISAK